MTKLKSIGLAVLVLVVGLGVVLGAYSGGFRAIIGSNPAPQRRGDALTDQPKALAAPQEVPAKTPLPEMPEHVRFNFLFEHLANIQDKPNILGNYQEKTGLTDGAFSALVQMAVAHEREASIIDQQAKIIIDNFHAQYPRNMPPGLAPPPPPQELLDLQDQRDALSLRYRDLLKTQIGNDTYIRFKQFIDEEFRQKPPIRQVTPPKRPVLAGRKDK